MLDVSSKLNKAQKKAVAHSEGPVMLVAGAGTGKTTVITNRIAWLIAQNKARPEEVLAVTFTEKAAAEMEERVDKLLPLGYTDLWIHTFHAFCQRVLEEHAIDLGLPDKFDVRDTTASWLLPFALLTEHCTSAVRSAGRPERLFEAGRGHQRFESIA
ncbi:unnamed protein product, partial [marine sediment metagenome]